MNTALQIDLETLDNGLRVVHAPRLAGSTSTVVRVNTGSRSEDTALAGGCHLMEHLFFKGTPSRPGPNDIAIEMDGLGANFNAMTATEETIFHATAPGRFGARCAEVLADMVLNAKLDAQDFEDEKAIVLEERRGRLDDPSIVAFEAASMLVFGDTPLGRPIIGTPDSIMALDHSLVLDHIRRHYVPSNIVVGIGGRFDEAAANAMIKPFAELPSAPTPELVPWAAPAEPEYVRGVDNDNGQVHLMLTFPGIELDHPDRPAFEMLVAAIGGGPSSRLYLEVRERLHLAYSLWVESIFARDTGAWAVTAAVEPDKIEVAIDAIVGELVGVRDHGLSAAEIDRARIGLVAQHEGLLDSAEQLLSWAVDEAGTRGRVPPFDEPEQKLDAVSADDLRRVAGQMIDLAQIRLVAVGSGATDDRLAEIQGNLAAKA